MEKGIDELLATHSFFSGLEPAVLKLISGCGKNVRFDEGEYLAREGDESNCFYAIRHGRVAIEIHVPQRGPVAIQTLQDPEMLGWSWLFPPYKWLFDARATQLTRAVQFDGACLRKKCDDNPAMGYDLMKRFAQVFAKRIEATRLQLLDVYGKASNT